MAITSGKGGETMPPVFPNLIAQRHPSLLTGPQRLPPFQTSWCESPHPTGREWSSRDFASSQPGWRRSAKALERRPVLSSSPGMEHPGNSHSEAISLIPFHTISAFSTLHTTAEWQRHGHRGILESPFLSRDSKKPSVRFAP